MASILSTKQRELIVDWRHNQGKVVDECAQLAACSQQTVYGILSLYHDHGIIHFGTRAAKGAVVSVGWCLESAGGTRWKHM